MSWREILHATGMLTRSHADSIDGAAWDQALESGDSILYRDAIWDPKQFQRGAHYRHRVMVSSIYLALSDRITDWGREVTHGEVSADARLRLQSSPWQYWLEADTGKETERQWQQKLDRYRATFWHPDDLLLVVARGRSTRLHRLNNWIGKATLPLNWTLLPADALLAGNLVDYAEWPLHHCQPLPPPPEPAPPRIEYWVEGHGLIPGKEVPGWQQRGYAMGYTEIIAGGERRVLVQTPSWFAKIPHR